MAFYDFSVIGMSFESLEASQRRTLQLIPKEAVDLAEELKAALPAGEALLIATEYRIEFYVTDHRAGDMVYRWLGQRRAQGMGIPSHACLRYELEGPDALRHLCRLVGGALLEMPQEGRAALHQAAFAAGRAGLVGERLQPVIDFGRECAESIRKMDTQGSQEHPGGALFADYIVSRAAQRHPHRDARVLVLADENDDEVWRMAKDLVLCGGCDVLYCAPDDTMSRELARQGGGSAVPWCGLGTELLLADYAVFGESLRHNATLDEHVKRMVRLELNAGLVVLDLKAMCATEMAGLNVMTWEGLLQVSHRQRAMHRWRRLKVEKMIDEDIGMWEVGQDVIEERAQLKRMLQDVEACGLQRLPAYNANELLRSANEINNVALNAFRGLLHDCAHYLEPESAADDMADRMFSN